MPSGRIRKDRIQIYYALKSGSFVPRTQFLHGTGITNNQTPGRFGAACRKAVAETVREMNSLIMAVLGEFC